MSLSTISFRHFPLEAGQLLLDLGCGEGRHLISAHSLERIEAIGVDASLRDLKISRERFQELHGKDLTAGLNFWLSAADGLQLPFADETFDRIICSEMLEHVIEFESVLSEIQRVLKPGGLLAVSVPSWFPEWVCWKLSEDYHNEPGGHVRIFHEKRLRQAIEQLDMTLYAKHHAHALHSPYWWLKCWFRGADREPWLLRLWHRMLVWDMMRAPFITRFTERLLNPVLGKSLVMYFSSSKTRATGAGS